MELNETLNTSKNNESKPSGVNMKHTAYSLRVTATYISCRPTNPDNITPVYITPYAIESMLKTKYLGVEMDTKYLGAKMDTSGNPLGHVYAMDLELKWVSFNRKAFDAAAKFITGMLESAGYDAVKTICITEEREHGDNADFVKWAGDCVSYAMLGHC